jgi:DNA polymerase-3 subunit gamma/tau
MKELYKKYRPKSLSELVGQQESVAILKEKLETNTLPHAVLFIGPSGAGKTTTARILRKELKCSLSDYQEINFASTRGIDTVREIDSRMRLAPMGGETRIYCLDEFHAATKDAQSSMLKMLEDTPEHVYFIICTTDPQKLLPTILTRCTQIKLKPLNEANMKVLISTVLKKENKSISESVYDRIIEVAEGGARKCLVLLDQILPLKKEEDQLNAILSSDAKTQGIDLARALSNPKGKWADVAKILSTIEEEPENDTDNQ